MTTFTLFPSVTDSTKFKLLATFRAMEQKIIMTTFNERLMLQKKVYLLQQLGLHLGNSYGWYLRGPYSRDVTNDGFYLETIQDKIGEVKQLLSEEEILVTQKLQGLINDARKNISENESGNLELLASLHFVLKYGYPKPSSKKMAIAQLTQQKTKFTTDAGKVAMQLLEKYGLADCGVSDEQG